MDRNFRKGPADGSGASPPSEAWLFAQALLGKPLPSPFRAEADARARREHLEWLAQISPEHERQLRGQLREEADLRAQRKQLEWLAAISTEHEVKLRSLRQAEASEAQQRSKWLAESATLHEAQWDPSKHPRGGYPQNPGEWSPAGGSGNANAKSPSSFLDAVAQRDATIANLTGGVTPGMLRSTRLAAALQSAIRLPGEVARAAAAGLGTGGKAVVNGSATAIKSVATLGLDTSQLELIGVTKEDRDRGYDTAVKISTASGQVLIAVGTGGVASALSKGGSVARTASGAILAFDAAGNAVGVVQGIYDATQNGVSISNGAQVAGGLLGLGANVNAVRGLKPTVSAKEVVPRNVPPTLHEVDLKGKIRTAGGSTLKEAGEFFGWEPSHVTKTPADFTKEKLLSKGWTKERLLDVAKAYEHIARLTPKNPSAAGRAKQLREIAAKLFGK